MSYDFNLLPDTDKEGLNVDYTHFSLSSALYSQRHKLLN